MNKYHPLISIIGVPNTGKSTLFNRLIGARKALIHNQPGMTRDVYTHTMEIDNKSFYIQDTGGYFDKKELIASEINNRIFLEAKRSDLIIFLFDGKRDLLGYEKELYIALNKIQKNIIPVINKVDHPHTYIIPDTYYFIKQDFILISAEHNQGIEDLFEEIPKRVKGEALKPLPENRPRVCIVGKPNVGKSSLINKLINEERAIVTPIPGTTRDSIEVEISWQQKKFILVDNAGIRKQQKIKEETESAAVIRAEKNIKMADIVVFIIDVSKRLDQNDLFIARHVVASAKPVLIIGNKWDLIEDKQNGPAITKKINEKLNQLYFAPILLTSTLSGKNIQQILAKVWEIDQQLQSKPKPSQLHDLVYSIMNEKKLINEKGQVFNPKHMIVEATKPFFIQFYCSNTEQLKAADELFLKKRIGESLGLQGIPIFFKVKKK